MHASVDHKGPIYIRVAKGHDPIVTTETGPFVIGKAVPMRTGGEVLPHLAGGLGPVEGDEVDPWYALGQQPLAQRHRVLDAQPADRGRVGRERGELGGQGGRERRPGQDRRPLDGVHAQHRHDPGHDRGGTPGGRHPVTPWGKPTKGKKTRTNKSTNKFILISRHKRKK